MFHHDYSFELKTAHESGAIAGLASTPAVDLDGDRILAGAFVKSVAHISPELPLPMLWAHNSVEPIGAWTKARETARGLEVAGEINLQTARGRETHALLKQKAVQGLSIGFSVPKGGSVFKNNIRELREIRLHEVSLVVFPANPDARVERVKTLETKADLERLLHQAGLSRREAKALLSGGWSALKSDPQDDLAALLARATQTLKRKNDHA